MNELNKCCNEAIDNGAMDEASLRLTITYMMISQAFAMYDDAIEILKEQNIDMGKDRYLVKRVYKAFDEYIEETQKLMEKSDTRRFSGEYDRISSQVESIIHKEMSCWDDDAILGKDYKICEMCGKRKNIDEFSKAYKCRCKSCVAEKERQRRKEKRNKEERLKGIVLRLDRKKMQARQIHPNTIIVPYQRAVDVVNELVKLYERQGDRIHKCK